MFLHSLYEYVGDFIPLIAVRLEPDLLDDAIGYFQLLSQAEAGDSESIPSLADECPLPPPFFPLCLTPS